MNRAAVGILGHWHDLVSRGLLSSNVFSGSTCVQQGAGKWAMKQPIDRMLDGVLHSLTPVQGPPHGA